MDENPNTGSIAELFEKDFEREVLQSMKPVLVAFGAAWSKPCAVLMSTLEEVTARCSGSARVFKVDVDQNPDLGLWYGIESIPTLIWFVHGREGARVVGTVSAPSILAKIDS